MEFASDGIRVHSVIAAFIQTEMGDQLRRTPPSEQFRAVANDCPLGLGTPGDAAYSIALFWRRLRAGSPRRSLWSMEAARFERVPEERCVTQQ